MWLTWAIYGAYTATQQTQTSPKTWLADKIQEETHLCIVRVLLDNPGLTQRELAEMLGMSVGAWTAASTPSSTRASCFVKMGNFQKSKNKFKFVYLLTPQCIAEKVALSNRCLKRKIEEYVALKVEIEAWKTEVGDEESGQKV